MQVLILAGGLGTRLSSVVSDRAKPVAPVAGRPFVSHLLAQVEACSEIESVVLCVGHRAETVMHALGARFGRLALQYSHEPEPLGTGGAMRLALASTNPSGEVLAMNGDSFLGIRLDRLIAYHRSRKPTVTLALAHVEDGSRFGTALLEGECIRSFREKGVPGPAWINAGIYVLSPAAVDDLERRPDKFSFEHDAVAAWCAAGEARGMKSRARFLDIGTPDDYARSESVLLGRG